MSAVLCSALIVGAAVGAALFVNVEGSALGRDATALGAATVSYTHLTLPTKRIV